MIDISAVAKALGPSAGAAALPLVAMYALFTPLDEHNQLVAKSDRGYILELVDRARSEQPGPFKDSMCKSLFEAIAELCAAAKDDAICTDRAMWIERAGC
jgi:hypothetical protein